MKKVLVTGGMGFIGRYVVEELLDRGYTPVIFDRAEHGIEELVRIQEEYNGDIEVFLGDVRDEVAMTEAAAHVDGIIHLAAVLGTQETIQNPRPAALSNLQGGLNFLEAVAQYDLPGVYICVGNHWMNNTYSITKTTVERFVHMFNKERGTRVNMIRAVNAYGPRQSVAAPYGSAKVRKITPSFITRALSGKPIEVYGDGSQVSDMVFVADVAYALVNALEAADQGAVFDKVVECGPKEHHTVKEVADLVVRCVQELKGIDYVGHKFLPMRPGEVPGDKVTADTSTLELVGMTDRDLVPIEDGMRATVQYYALTEGATWSNPQDVPQL